MRYHATSGRCAIDLDAWQLSISHEEAVHRLTTLGLKLQQIDIEHVALSLVGKASYQRGASLELAPQAFDCSSLIKWLYAQVGIWLPRRCIFLAEEGLAVHEQIKSGDLVFLAKGARPPLASSTGATHVGLVVSNGSIIHATGDGIKKESLESWRSAPGWRGARRIVPSLEKIATFVIPLQLHIETSDDVLWLLLEKLRWPG